LFSAFAIFATLLDPLGCNHAKILPHLYFVKDVTFIVHTTAVPFAAVTLYFSVFVMSETLPGLGVPSTPSILAAVETSK